jgi:hypothetical protein
MTQPVVSDPVVMPLARELLQCLDEEISKVASPPLYVQLRPGTVVDHLLSTTDDECCRGLAWVRPVTFVPSSGTFPAPDDAPMKGGPRSWAVTLELGAIRCVPTPPPALLVTGEQWDAVVQAVMDDAAAMRRAICCFAAASPGRWSRMTIGAWQPISVQGGCTGGILPVTLQGPACDCSETSAPS